MGELPSIITATFGGLATIGGVAVLWIKARNQGAVPRQVLRRLYDWIEGHVHPTEQPLIEQVPPRLRADIERALDEEEE